MIITVTKTSTYGKEYTIFPKCCDVKTPGQKATSGAKGLFELTALSSYSVTDGSQDKNSRQEPEGRN